MYIYKDFDIASKQLRKVVELNTSNPETEVEEDQELTLPSRIVRVPSRYQYSEEDDDEHDNNEDSEVVIALPVPPNSTQEAKDNEQERDDERPSTSRGVHIPRSSTPSSQGNLTEEEGWIPDPQPSMEQVLHKLTSLEQKIDAIYAGLLTKGAPGEEEATEDLLPGGRKLDTIDDLHTFESQLVDDENSKRKILRVLCTMSSGEDLAKCCRAVMRSMLTNGLMSLFSTRGQKGKLSFNERSLSKLIISAIRKMSGGKHQTNSIVFEIGEVLRNAPNQPGGANYIKKQGKSARKATSDTGETQSDEDL